MALVKMPHPTVLVMRDAELFENSLLEATLIIRGDIEFPELNVNNVLLSGEPSIPLQPPRGRLCDGGRPPRPPRGGVALLYQKGARRGAQSPKLHASSTDCVGFGRALSFRPTAVTAPSA